MKITDTFSNCSVSFMSTAISILQKRIEKLNSINELLLAYGDDATLDIKYEFYKNSVLIREYGLNLEKATKALQDKVYSVESN